MKILVTGGNGYVGRNLCRQAYNTHEIICVDNLRYGENRFEKEELNKFTFVEADIRNTKEMKSIFDKYQPDAIIHLAAIHFIPECENNPSDAISTNVEGTTNLLDLCPKHCRFIFASSAAVYAPEDNAHREEQSVIGPMDVYGWTKLHGEHFVEYYAEKNGFPAIIARLFNVIGPGETNPHVLPEIFAQLKSGRTTLSLGNMTPKRDYISAFDAAKAFLTLAMSGDIENGTATKINVGTHKQYSVSELVDMMRNVSGLDITVEQDPSRMRPSDRPFLMADNSKLQKMFDWQPEHTIEKVIEEMWGNPDLPKSLLQKYQ